MKIFIPFYLMILLPTISTIAQVSEINTSNSESKNNLMLNKQSQTLPVELIYFYAEIQSNGILLKWGTATEVNNLGFDIERAYNSPSSWETIDFVLGSGTSNVPIDYVYLDSSLIMSGIFYYRLKQIDIIGDFEYSDTIMVNLISSVKIKDDNLPKNFDLLQNYPNPFNSTTNFKFNIAQMSVINFELFDINGQKMRTLFSGELYPGTYSYQLFMDDFSSGIYLVKFYSKNYSTIKKILLLK